LVPAAGLARVDRFVWVRIGGELGMPWLGGVDCGDGCSYAGSRWIKIRRNGLPRRGPIPRNRPIRLLHQIDPH
jgi:hypothetical protein